MELAPVTGEVVDSRMERVGGILGAADGWGWCRKDRIGGQGDREKLDCGRSL